MIRLGRECEHAVLFSTGRRRPMTRLRWPAATLRGLVITIVEGVSVWLKDHPQRLSSHFWMSFGADHRGNENARRLSPNEHNQ